MKHTVYLLYLLILVGITGCKKSDNATSESQYSKNLEEYNKVTQGLKDYFSAKDYFYMGAAISPAFLNNSEKVKLIKRHFNSLTTDNAMKWSSLQPTEGNFNFTDADAIVAFAQANGMKIRGHCLCWHNQVPAWVFMDGDAVASRELVLQRLRTHITTVMTHFKGKVYAWDVVNEAIDDGSATYRASQWYNICGEDYITEAFKDARASDTDALLFYNDYSAIDPTKRDKIYSLLVKLKNQNLVDGMGLQGHWNSNYPPNSLITDAFDKYKSLGLDLQITELDVSVYTSNSDPESPYTTELSQDQSMAYGRFFSIFRAYKDYISGITFWGLADDTSWLDNFPVAGRKNYPLLFNENLDPKPAYFEIIDF